MTIKVDLRAEADAEAARIRGIRTKLRADPPATRPDAVPAAALRCNRTAGLDHAAIIFVTRTRIVDGRGRLVEDLVIPVEVRCSVPATRGRRRDVGLHAQRLFDRCYAVVRSVCLAEVARHLTSLASEYGRGLERARTRESRLTELAETERRRLVQPGLFDRAASDPAPVEHHGRREALDHASLLVAQRSETVLLLLVGSAA
jgi:hypothetical protein